MKQSGFVLMKKGTAAFSNFHKGGNDMETFKKESINAISKLPESANIEMEVIKWDLLKKK
jgi:hypothetical protein